jgi:hypothetical protein
LNEPSCDDGLLVEGVEKGEPVVRSATHARSDARTVPFPQPENVFGSFRRFSGNLSNAVYEELKPAFPGSFITNGLQASDVLISVLLEEDRWIQERFLKDSLFHEPEGYEKPPDPSVTVEKGMNGFELSMC